MIVGGLITFPFTWLKWEWNILSHLSLSGWMGILFLGVFCSGLAYLFWYSALEKKDSGLVGMYLYLEPLVTLIGAYFLLNEEIQWVTLVGGGMILLGVCLAARKVSSPFRQSLSGADKTSRQKGEGFGGDKNLDIQID